MGNIRTKDIKKMSHQLYDLEPEKFKDDFETNKQVIKDMNIESTKIIRNKVAGYITRVARNRKRQQY